jgi:hypothetical protein
MLTPSSLARSFANAPPGLQPLHSGDLEVLINVLSGFGSIGSLGSTIFGTPPTKSPALKNDSRFRSGRFSNGPSVWRYNSNCGSLNCYAPNFRD